MHNSEYTKTHRDVCFIGVDSMVCEIYLNKALGILKEGKFLGPGSLDSSFFAVLPPEWAASSKWPSICSQPLMNPKVAQSLL